VQQIALYLFFFSINFEVLELFSNFSVAKFSAILYIMTILPQIRQFFHIENLKSLLLPILLFFILLTINNLININELYFEVFNQSIVLNLLIFIIMINHVRKDYMILENALLSFAFGTMLLTLFFLVGFGVDYVGGRVRIFGENQNDLGLKISVGLIIILIAVVQNRLKWGWFRFLLLLPVPFMLWLLAETGSRVAVISFVVAFGIGVILIKTDEVWKKVMMFIAGAIIFIGIAVQMMNSEMLAERFLSSYKGGDLSGRDQIWARIIPLIKDHPVFGVGNTGYDFYNMINFSVVKSPHNVILEILCYTGIVGLILYFAFLYQLFLRGYSGYLKNGWLLPLLLFCPVLGMILSGQILHDKLAWVIFGYIVSCSAIPFNKISIPR